MCRALKTGVMGQDGAYLAEHLIGLGYEVIGTSRSYVGSYQLPFCSEKVSVVRMDPACELDIRELVASFQPDEIYNLAAKSSSQEFNSDPQEMISSNGLAVRHFLEAIRISSPKTRFCQAGSSEVFAGTTVTPQTEDTRFRPLNLYGVSKVFAANIVDMYRASYGLFACNAILYNHESPLRSASFVTRKITKTAAEIAAGKSAELVLGSLDSRRDWGFAGDYMRALYLMLQDANASDYILGTGATHSVRDICAIAFSYVGLDYTNYVRLRPEVGRRPETVELRGDSAKARAQLKWAPSVAFDELIRSMVDHDISLLT